MKTTTISGGTRKSWDHARVWLSATLILGLMVVLPSSAPGAIYRYIERDGTLIAADVPPDPRVHRPAQPRLPGPGIAIGPRELNQAIRWYARRHRLSPALLRAVIKAESDFNPRAVSPTGAIGLMQLMPKTAASLNVHDPFNPIENIRGGAKHLRYLLDRFEGNLPLALAAYNAGEYRVKRHCDRIPPIRETQEYVEKVLSYYETFRKPTRSHASRLPLF